VPGYSISIRVKYLLISLAIVAALIFYASTYAEPVLRVSLMPDESPSMLRRKLKPLTDYLEKKIGIKIEFRPVSNGNALVEALISHQLDIVWIDSDYLSRAKARSNEQIIPLVQRERDGKSPSVFTGQPGYHDYYWTVSAAMNGDLREKLTNAFLALNMNNAQHKEILNLQRVNRYIPVRTENNRN
jgi:ABC-type phosphate/phosphonate transport system substrate-binding protein